MNNKIIIKNLSVKTLKGFTLIEALLYIALVSVVLLSFVGLITTIVESQNKTLVITEVNQNGAITLDYIGNYLRSSDSINAPTAGNSASNISFVNGAINPVLIQINSGVIEIKEGANPYVALTSNKVTASGLTFKNLTPTGENEVIEYEFTLTYINPDNRSDLNYSKTFYGTSLFR